MMRYVYPGVVLIILCIYSIIYAEHLLSQTLPFRTINDDYGLRESIIMSHKNTTSTPTNVIAWHGKRDLKQFMRTFFDDKNLVCNLASKEAKLLNITFGCQHLFENSGLGSGNFLVGFYAIRLAAMFKGNIDVSIHCPDAYKERDKLLLPWLTGYFPASASKKDELVSRMNQFSVRHEDVCGNIDVCPIGLMFSEIQNELRRMAIALVGLPDKNHFSHHAVKTWMSQHEDDTKNGNKMFLTPSYTPLYQNVELDDVIVHFRCGDLMSSQHPRFAFLKYNAFASRISPNATSIGIVTQPFDESAQNRAWDSSSVKRNRCKTVVLDFEQYLRETFPRANIRIHNSPNETIALTYARMIMANQSIAGISTFGVLSSIASFGTGYIRLPDNRSATNQWLTNPPLISAHG